MSVPILAGGQYAGRIWRYRDTFVETRFLHIWFVPVYPVGGVLVRGTELPGAYERRPIPLSARSVICAYLRVWPALLCLAMLASWWGAWWWYTKLDGGLAFVGIALVLTTLGWVLGGRAPAAHRARVDAWLDHRARSGA